MLDIASKLPFNVQFYKLLYTNWLGTPTRFDAQDINLSEGTI